MFHVLLVVLELTFPLVVVVVVVVVVFFSVFVHMSPKKNHALNRMIRPGMRILNNKCLINLF